MWLLSSLTTLALGHGGSPQSLSIQWDTEHGGLLTTTHGLISEAAGWGWICEEIVSPELVTGALRTPRGDWLLATTGGVWHSADGCSWALTLQSTYVSGIAGDTADAGVVWAASLGGLWRSPDHGETWELSLEVPEHASIRSFVQADDGTFFLLGFDEDQMTAWITDGSQIIGAPIPEDGARVHALGTDPRGRAYARFPAVDGTDVLRRILPDGTSEVLLESGANLTGLVVDEDVLYVSIRDQGIRTSLDDGATFTPPEGEPLACLARAEGQWLGCPGDTGDLALLTSWSTEPEPGAWTEALYFPEITGPLDCPEDSELASVCGPLWDEVALQLGVEDDASVTTGAQAAEIVLARGCHTAQGAALSWLALAPLGLVLLHRQGSPGAHTRRSR